MTSFDITKVNNLQELVASSEVYLNYIQNEQQCNKTIEVISNSDEDVGLDSSKDDNIHQSQLETLERTKCDDIDEVYEVGSGLTRLPRLGYLEEFYIQDSAYQTGKTTYAVTCKLCPKNGNETKTVSSSIKSNYNLKKHLKTKHIAAYEVYLNTLTKTNESKASVKRKFENETTSTSKQQKTISDQLTAKGNHMSQNQFEKYIVNMIVKGFLPFSIVEADYMVEFLSNVAPNKKIPNRKSVRELVFSDFDKMKRNLIGCMNEISYFCTTADIWSANNKSYLGVTAHWIEPNTLNRQSVGLACSRLMGSHTFDVIGPKLEQIFNNYGIAAKIVKTITDNGSNMMKAFKVFATENSAESNSAEEDQFLLHINFPSANQKDEDIDESVDIVEDISAFEILDDNDIDTQFCQLPPHFRCAAYSLNLVATTDSEKAFLINKAFKLLFRSAFAKCAALWNKYSRSVESADFIRNEIGIALMVPCVTRWNSYFDAVAKIRKISDDKLFEFCKKMEVKPFSKSEIAFLDEYLSVMKCLASALDFLQSEKNCFIGNLLPTIITIQNKLAVLKPNLKFCNPLVSAILQGLDKRFGHYFRDEEMIIASSTIPNLKLFWLKSGIDADFARNLVKRKVEQEMQKQSSTSAGKNSSEGIEESFFIFHTNHATAAVTNEFEQFLLDPSKDLNILQKYPAVKQVFLKYNTCLTSSAPVERLFSGGKLILTPQRNRLSDVALEKLLLLQKNSAFLQL